MIANDNSDFDPDDSKRSPPMGLESVAMATGQ